MRWSVALASIGLAAALVAGLAWARPDLVPDLAGEGAGCARHGVPERFCTICHPDLQAVLTLCAEHGNIPAEICTLCHPAARRAHRIEMCPLGHGLPKHFCARCGAQPFERSRTGDRWVRRVAWAAAAAW
jgi:hypothetical protein